MADLTPYSYRPGNTPLHRAGAGTKLLLLCALSFASFFAGLHGLGAATILTLAAAAAARLPFPSLLSGSKSLALATGLVVILRACVLNWSAPPYLGIDRAGLAEGLLFAWGVFASFAAGSVLFATTTAAELRFALARAEGAISRRLAPLLPRRIADRLAGADLSLAIALALAFIPRVFSAWETAEDAYRARCGRRGPQALFDLVPLVAERLMEAAAETAHAMESRGYRPGGRLD